MKKILISAIFVFLLTNSMCSAAKVRVCDYGLNDFVTFYNKLSNTIYENDRKYNLKFNERPFKNIALSDKNYNVYTSTVGKDKNNIVTVHFFVDKNGYVSKISAFGNTKKTNQEDLITSVITLCLISCGINVNSVIEWADLRARSFFISNNKGWFDFPDKRKRIYIESVSADTLNLTNVGQYEPFFVYLYGESM